MATTKFFNGTTELKGGLYVIRNDEFARRFPGVKGLKSDGYSRMTIRDSEGNLTPVTRMILRKSNPSNHKCDARCRNAKGHSCECSCGGKYHGAGDAE